MVRLFPLDVGSCQCVRPITGCSRITTEIGRGLTHQRQGRIRRNILITDDPITGTEFQVADNRTDLLHKLFIRNRPGKSHRREVAPLIVCETTGTVGTESTRKHIAVIVIINHTTHTGKHRPVRITVGSITRQGIGYVPPPHGFHLNVLSADAHGTGIALGRFPYSRSGQVMFIRKHLIISEVIRRLEQNTLRIVVTHAVATIAINLQRRETIRCIVIVVDTIASGKSQSIHNLKAKIHMAAHHITTTLLLIVTHDTQRIVLNGTVRVVIIIPLCIQQLHTWRIVESNPQRIRATQFQATDTFTDTT